MIFLSQEESINTIFIPVWAPKHIYSSSQVIVSWFNHIHFTELRWNVRRIKYLGFKYSHPLTSTGNWSRTPILNTKIWRCSSFLHKIVDLHITYRHPPLYLNNLLITYNTSYNVNAMKIAVTLYCLENNDKKSVHVQHRCNLCRPNCIVYIENNIFSWLFLILGLVESANVEPGDTEGWMYCSMSFDNCIHPCNYHPKENTDHFHHLWSSPCTLFQSTLTPYHLWQPLSDFHHHRLLLQVLHANEIIHPVFAPDFFC